MVVTRYNRYFILSVLIATMMILLPNWITAADELFQTVSIERLCPDSTEIADTLEVTISPEYAIGGFDFKIATDSRSVSVVDILPGELIDSCRWEYFKARPMSLTLSGDSHLTALWQVVGLAEMFATGDTVLCRRFDRDVSLMRIALTFNSSRLPRDTAAAVFSYWSDCGDNTVSVSSGDTLSVSVRVEDFFEPSWPDTGGHFPTHLGALPQCISDKAEGRILPRLVFRNGGVRLPFYFGEARADSIRTDSIQPANTSR